MELADTWVKDPVEPYREKLLAQPSLSISETCVALDVSRWTVMRWITQGRLSGEKIGRTKRIPSDQIRRLLEDGETVRAFEIKVQHGRFTVMSEAQVRQVTAVLAKALTLGLMPVTPEELAEVVRGHEHAGPIFWSSLAAGIERLSIQARFIKLVPVTSGEPGLVMDP